MTKPATSGTRVAFPAVGQTPAISDPLTKAPLSPPAPWLTQAELPRPCCDLLTVNRSQLVREFTEYASPIEPYLREISSYTIQERGLFLHNASSFWAWGGGDLTASLLPRSTPPPHPRVALLRACSRAHKGLKTG